jgi:hypothetical protein
MDVPTRQTLTRTGSDAQCGEQRCGVADAGRSLHNGCVRLRVLLPKKRHDWLNAAGLIWLAQRRISQKRVRADK